MDGKSHGSTTAYDRVQMLHSRMLEMVDMASDLINTDWGDDQLGFAGEHIAEIAAMAEHVREISREMMGQSFAALRSKYQTMSLSDLAIEMTRQKADLERAGKYKSMLQKEYDHLVISVVPDMMEDQNVETLKVPKVGRLQTTSDIYCSCKAAKREELQKWLKEYGHEALISKVVNASTLKAFVKEQMKKGNEYPGEILDITPYSKATVVKA